MEYGLIGKKLGHSFSKTLHSMFADYDYELREVSENELDEFMRKKDFSGINVTIPYKQAVIPYLDEIDEAARKIGAVNTVVNRNGKLYGYNTDFGGLKMLIEKQGFDYKNKKVLILGTGGTSKTANAVAKSQGACEVFHVSRKGELNYTNAHLLHPDASFIINTTPCGMYPDNYSAPIELSAFKNLSGVTDVIYNPVNTTLSLEAKRLNINADCGLYMLVCQAVLAFEKFKEKELDSKRIAQEVFKRLLKDKQNIVLIGMPGSGKSTVGKVLSKITGKPFVDTDDEISERYGVISDIFKEKGEAYFRTLETETVKEVSQQGGKIIATGGGAILKRENVSALKQNGVLFFLNRPIENIVPTADRPLSSDVEALKKRFEERYEKYLEAADYEITADDSIQDAANKIREIFYENTCN